MPLDCAPRDLIALKTATFDLIKLVGGLARAAQLTGYSTTQVQRWYAPQSHDDPDAASRITIPLVAAMLLERDLIEQRSPLLPITQCLARLAGRELGDPKDVLATSTFADQSAAIMRLSGEFGATAMTVLADGRVTPAEATEVDRIASKIDQATANMRATLAAVRAGATSIEEM